MTRLSHLVCLVFGAALALGAAALLMVALAAMWPNSGPTAVIVTALVIALATPLAAALASRRWISGGQPLNAWLTGFAAIILLALAATLVL